MPRHARPSPSALLIAVAFAVAAIGMVSAATGGQTAERWRPVAAAPRTLPHALSAALPHAGVDVVAAINVDIDTDGDLDVVAVDSTLQLYVWINDGDGHFTRRAPVRPGQWGDDRGPLAERTPSGAVAVSAPAGRSWGDRRTRAHAPPLTAYSPAFAPLDDSLLTGIRPASPSRAPPVFSLA